MLKEISDEIIKTVDKTYTDLRDQKFIEIANGSLSKLCNLRGEFDESFDQFFDNKALRKKYNALDENGNPDYDISNNDLKQILDEGDKKLYIEFVQNLIDKENINE